MSSVPLDDYRGFVVDIDGVLVRGPEVIVGAPDALQALAARGPLVLLSNNATRSRRGIAERLRSLGFDVDAGNVVNSAFIVARHLQHVMGPASVFVVGESGLREELELAGHAVVDPVDAEVVVTGMDRELTYGKLADALRALVGGARYVATNADATFPTPDGPTPGAGAIVGALRGMGHPPDEIVGKPSPTAFEIALETLGVDDPRDCLVVGDRLETDIDGALNVGCEAALVLTGVTPRTALDEAATRSFHVLDDLSSLV
jgi:HAD superfamily hydrolase (TIGR01450 family)